MSISIRQCNVQLHNQIQESRDTHLTSFNFIHYCDLQIWRHCSGQRWLYSTWLHSARMHFVLTLPNATEHSACRNILQHHAQMQHWFSYMQPCKQKTDKNQHLLTEFCSIYLHKIHPCLWLIAAVFIIAKNDMKIKCLSHWSTRNTNRPDQWRRDHTGNEMEGHSQKWQMGHTKVCALPRARVGSVWHPGYEERSGGKGHEWKGDRLLGQSEASVSDREQRFMKTENRENVIESQGKRKREIDSWWIEVKGRTRKISREKQQH